MDFDQLHHFQKVAELGSFTRAAEALGYSQPALSRSIARLEEELGQPLFERQTRAIALTEAGKLLLARAQQILAMVSDAKAEIKDDGQSGQIRIAAIPTIAPYFLPQFLADFRRDFPLATVLVQEDTTDNLLRKVNDGEVDIAVLARPVEARYLHVEDLFEEELLLVMAADHPLSKKRQIRIEDVETQPFVLLNETHCLTDNVLAFCHQKSFHPVSVERTSQLATIQELVALQHGVSLVPAMAREKDHSQQRMYRSLSGPRPTRKIVMVTNRYRFQSRLQKSVEERFLALRTSKNGR